MFSASFLKKLRSVMSHPVSRVAIHAIAPIPLTATELLLGDVVNKDKDKTREPHEPHPFPTGKAES